MAININSTISSSTSATRPFVLHYSILHVKYNRKFIAISIYHMAQQPDLQAILATLAQYSQPITEQPLQQTPYQPAEFDQAGASISANDNSSATIQNARVESLSADPRLRGRPQSRSITPSLPHKQDQPPPPSVIDPATITVWQDGLRCVTKIAAQNKMFEATIRRVSFFSSRTDQSARAY
jgi:hypothetical protein